MTVLVIIYSKKLNKTLFFYERRVDLPPAAVLLHLSVRGKGPRNNRAHHHGSCTLLALDQRRQAGALSE